MTTNDIDAIRKLADAATAGPWRAHTTYPHTVWQGQENDDDPGIVSTTLAREVVADAEFIAAARTYVPALCDEIEQLRAELAEYAADNQRVAAALVKTDAQLTAAQQNIRDRYEHIAKLELLVADLETQCNEQMHQLTAANHRADTAVS